MLNLLLPTGLRDASQSRQRRAILAVDLILIAIAYSLGQAVVSGEEFWISARVEPLPFVSSLSVVVLAVLAGLWLDTGSPSLGTSFTQISRALGIAFLLEALLSYGRVSWLLPPSAMLVGSAFCGLFLVAWRELCPAIFPGLREARRILFVGAGEINSELLRYFGARPKAFKVLGPLDGAPASREAIERYQPHRVVVEWNAGSPPLSPREMLELRQAGIELDGAVAAYESTFHRVCTARLDPSRMVFRKLEPRKRNLAWQAIYSNLAGLVLLIGLFPLLVLIWLSLKLTAPREPAIESCDCAGFSHIPFVRLRFQARSPLGRLIRRAGLGGLPQLFNVVRGEMALVGPEPDRREFAALLAERIPYYAHRLSAKPGLTGWAQIHRPGLDVLLRLEFDLYYIREVSPGFDLEVLARTLFGGI
ncbi:MAG: sugar transferase [Bryobacteraceae bacterium]